MRWDPAHIDPLGTNARTALHRAVTDALGHGAVASLADALVADLAEHPGPVVVALGGPEGLIDTLWSDDEALAEEGGAREEGAAGLTRILTVLAARRERWPAWQCVWIGFGRDVRRLQLANKQPRTRLYANIARGIIAMDVRVGKKRWRISPIDVLAASKPTRDQLIARAAAEEITGVALEREATVRTWDTAQYLIVRDNTRHARSWKAEPERAVPVFRGQPIVAVQDVTKETVHTMAMAWGEYLRAHVEEDGRLHYMFSPIHGERHEAGNNMIRQWMATVAMVRLGHFLGDDARTFEIAERNIRFNLRHYYYAKAELGFIEYKPENAIKLGAIALAAIALIEHPKRAEFERPERKLRETVDRMWCPDGRFYTTWPLVQREFGSNFYPGEALLMWSIVYKESEDPALLAKFMASFSHYRAWHLEHRNPAFIPWHTQAYANVWSKTRDPELAAFVFEMNDWLITEMQQWGGNLPPDAQGRFHSPLKPFGPPHASSDGVYLEGLVDALWLARELGDRDRAERYRVAIARGLRSVMQQTYLDPLSVWYGPHADRAVGGVRTNVYNLDVRCDNVQHNLMGVLRVLDRLAPEDYRTDPPPPPQEG